MQDYVVGLLLSVERKDYLCWLERSARGVVLTSVDIFLDTLANRLLWFITFLLRANDTQCRVSYSFDRSGAD